MTNDDNREVLNLINSMTIKGEIEVSFTKEPNYLDAMYATADTVQPVIGIYQNKVEVLGTRSIKKAYINREAADLGYLSDLKISKNVKKMNALTEGFSYMKNLITDGRANIHLATIIDDNRLGKAVLTWKSKSSQVANFYDYGILNTYFILPIFPKFTTHKIKITRGCSEILDDIVKFLNEEGRKKQFFPVYTKEFFLNLPNFKINDFYIATDENKNIIGAMAKWEQTPFKQVIIKKYSGKWNFIKQITGNILPSENEPIKQFYISFAAIKNNNNGIFEQLLNKIYNDNRKYKYFSLILHEKDNLNTSMKKYINIKYKSRLYIAGYEKAEQYILDDEIPYIELASL